MDRYNDDRSDIAFGLSKQLSARQNDCSVRIDYGSPFEDIDRVSLLTRGSLVFERKEIEILKQIVNTEDGIDISGTTDGIIRITFSFWADGR